MISSLCGHKYNNNDITIHVRCVGGGGGAVLCDSWYWLCIPHYQELSFMYGESERRLRNTNSPITRLKWPPTSAFTAVSTIQDIVLRTGIEWMNKIMITI